MAKTDGAHGSASLAKHLQTVEELLPLIEAEADAAERQFHMSDRVVAALRQAGLYAMLLPQALGGGELPFIEIALIRLAMRHIHDALSEVTTFAHRAVRGASLRSGTIQRCYRDAHAGTQHLLLADEIVMECGRTLMGATGPGAYWTMFGVKG